MKYRRKRFFFLIVCPKKPSQSTTLNPTICAASDLISFLFVLVNNDSSDFYDLELNSKSNIFFTFFPVKAPSKKAEKNKKSPLKNPNSISEGDGLYNSLKAGEWKKKHDDTHLLWEIHDLIKIHLSTDVHGSSLHFHRSRYDGKKETNSLWDDKYFGKASRVFRKLNVPWEKRSGSVRWCSQRHRSPLCL